MNLNKKSIGFLKKKYDLHSSQIVKNKIPKNNNLKPEEKINIFLKDIDSFLDSHHGKDENLNKWIIFLKETRIYPSIKYWIFHSVLKMSSHYSIDGGFSKRSKSTKYPYPVFNKEIATKAVMLFSKKLRGKNIKKIDEKILDLMDFRKFYSYLYINRIEYETEWMKNNTDGIWKKITQNNKIDENFFGIISQASTDWCIAHSKEILSKYLSTSYLYIYFSKNKKGEYNIPRIAILISDENNQVLEVRGDNEHQFLRPEFSPIFKKKIEELKNNGIIYD